ncbi:histone-like nucleoid-structuring protein, MvaT/MvaU family [Kushneria phosphatilytica]|uniref:H-NS histone family protein n=1 Tax=Kushneria phosphatilytica TaxID=657387 RepID=A0A1S1NWX0_9GAMM|nr:histone-like nucleoid-structuring protein, MvaT/MvaU family [Kushneria phosphatilytica]OHV12060.1 H-NS histone [Kushneria phosphatilytica]QEL11251.1 H-NS histone family protein [Kushneria phosphatilytica]
MSLLNEYMQKEQQLRQLRDELQQLEQDQRLKSELEFKEKLEALMSEYDKNASDIIAILDPERRQSGQRDTSRASNGTSGSRRKRKLKVYRNPHTGEVVETRGGNHKTLKAWKEEYGNDTVENWVERTES